MINQRHLARVVSFQILYQLDFADFFESRSNGGEQAIDKILNYFLKEFSFPSFSFNEFAKKLVKGTIEKQKEIDKWIAEFASDWPIKQISIIDRNILRIGIFELIFSKETPPKVVIDESIELAKRFGSETSGRFVNGVLGAIFEKIKKEIIEKKDDKKSIPLGEKNKDKI